MIDLARKCLVRAAAKTVPISGEERPSRNGGLSFLTDAASSEAVMSVPLRDQIIGADSIRDTLTVT
jgi:hypothetical protein